jgi:NAD(P)H-flavin reductase
LTNVSSPAATQAGEILNQVNEGSNINDSSPLIQVHGRRIKQDDLDAKTGQDDTVYYICGPPPMTDDFVQYLEPVVGKERVLYEKWW